MRVHLILVIALVSSSAHAQPADESALDHAPPPGAESGRVDLPEGESAARTVGRTILYVPRGVIELTLAPVRGSIYANDRYHVVDTVRSWFFSEGGTFGVYPMLFYDSTYGVLAGAEAAYQPTDRHRLEVFAGGGLYSRYRVSGEYRTSGYFNDTLGLRIGAELDRLPRSRFYGIGNGDEIDTPPMPLDPLNETVAALSYFDDRLARASALLNFEVAPSLFVDVGVAATDRRNADSSRDPSIEMVFDTNLLVGFEDYRTGYAELGLRYDTRRPYSDWQPHRLISTGSLVSGYGGYTVVDDGGSNFWRGGINLQQFIPLGIGPRTLSFRFDGEAISATPEEAPFTELPALGGRQWLRGYQTDRFRDQVAAVASAEYQWDLAQWLLSSVFVDVGRVYPGLDDLTLSDLRCGFGLALEVHTAASMLGRVSVASSIDGGAFVTLYLDPVSDIEPRVRRR